jgi:hypothetical protein
MDTFYLLEVNAVQFYENPAFNVLQTERKNAKPVLCHFVDDLRSKKSFTKSFQCSQSHLEWTVVR